MTNQTTTDEHGPQQSAAAGESDNGGKAAVHAETSGEPTVADEASGADAVASETETEADETSGEDAAGTEAGAAKRRRWPSRRLLWMSGGVLAVVVLLVCGLMTWQALNQDNKVLTQVAGTQIGRDPRNSALANYNDSETRFRVSFPASWATQRVGGADVRLVAGPGGGDLMSVRVVSLDTGSASPPTADSLKPYLDTIVSEPGVTMLQQNQITMGNLPGWYYVYTFKDGATGAVGVHCQYFLIRGTQLYSIVFQALPQSDFSALAPVYQQVANSIQFY